MDFGALLQQERARMRRERAKAAADGGGCGIDAGADTTYQPEQGDGVQDAILAAALSKLAAAAGGESTGPVDVNVMAVTAARTVEEAKATKRLMQATLPGSMLAGWLHGRKEALELEVRSAPLVE